METIEIRPQPGRQEKFLSSSADIAIYGGSAGGGKTWSMLLDPLRWVNISDFGAVLFRRTYPEVTNQGGMWDESEKVYSYAGGRPVKGDLYWKFASGARVSFAHMQTENDRMSYQGAQIPVIGFDQLETFSDSQFFYMMSRNRSMCGVRPYIRATCNPDPDSFLASFLSWWIADDGYADLSREGVVRWFARIVDKLVWYDTRGELLKDYPDADPKSVTFIPATVYDNKKLLARDPGYLANLKALSYVDRERLLGDPVRGGNWKIKPAAGKVFNRSWFEIVDSLPRGGVECRAWDCAATEKSLQSPDPDYTAGVKMLKHNGIYYITDVICDRYGPADVDPLLVSTCVSDAREAKERGARYMTRWEIEPGSAGIRESVRMTRMLQGYDAIGEKSTGDKLTRWKPFAAQCSVGNVKLLRGPWNEMFLNHLHGQPDIAHDDMTDGGSLAFNSLVPQKEEKKQEDKRSPVLSLRSI